MPTAELLQDKGFHVDLKKIPVHTPPVELFGHVVLVEGYNLEDFKGCHALVELRDMPKKTVAVLTTEPRLQSLLETGLDTHHLIAFWGTKMMHPPSPMGGTWAVDVYNLQSVILYNVN